MWIVFSISAVLCFAVVNIIDKYVLTKWIREPIVPVMILGIVGIIASLLVYLFHGFSYLSPFHILLNLITGVFFILMCVLYFKALKIEEVSKIIPLFYLSPLFILILAAIFLDEIFTPLKYLGIFLVVIGAILISSKSFFKIKFGKAFWLMLLATLSVSISIILTKYLLNFTDFWTVFAYTRIGTMILIIPIFCFYLPELIDTIKRHGKKVVGMISINETINLLGILLITIAMSIGFVTLINALSSIQPFFVLLFIILLSRFFPKILKEEISKTIIFQKLIAIILMFIGIILIT